MSPRHWRYYIKSSLFSSSQWDPCLPTNNRIAAAGTAASCLQQYYSTKDVWMPGTIVWPTILNLLAALVIVTWSGIVLCGYCFGRAMEKRLEKHSELAGVIKTTLSAFAPNFLPQFMPTHPDLLSLASCPSLMPTAFYILLHFGPESASLRNAIMISTIEKCSPLSNASSTGVTTSKDLSILSTFAQITRTWKSSCLRKS